MNFPNVNAGQLSSLATPDGDTALVTRDPDNNYELREVTFDELHEGLTGNVPVADITFVPAAGAANVCDVVITVVDKDGTAIAKPFLLEVWLSDAATGAGHTATGASGTVTAKSASGLVVDTHVAKKSLLVQTLATGIFTLEITDTAKTGFYVAAMHPGDGHAVVSDQLVTADYGA